MYLWCDRWHKEGDSPKQTQTQTRVTCKDFFRLFGLAYQTCPFTGAFGSGSAHVQRLQLSTPGGQSPRCPTFPMCLERACPSVPVLSVEHYTSL